jgi:hypothetical protein
MVAEGLDGFLFFLDRCRDEPGCALGHSTTLKRSQPFKTPPSPYTSVVSHNEKIPGKRVQVGNFSASEMNCPSIDEVETGNSEPLKCEKLHIWVYRSP